MKLPNAERAVVDIGKLRDLGVEPEGVVGAGLAEARGRWGEKRGEEKAWVLGLE